MTFNDTDLFNKLENTPDQELDNLDFGIIGLTPDMYVSRYNKKESLLSGLSKEFVLNKHFFIDVAPCMNNYLVALKFEQQAELDENLDYVLTFRMAPTYVKLRLLKKSSAKTSYIIIRQK